MEIHGANGYLLQQFFAPNANQRTDAYGGSIENRARFAIEVAKAIADEIGPEKTAIRLSPGATLGGLDEGSEGPELYRYLVGELNRLGLAYVHIMHFGNEALLADIRRLWHQTLIVNRPGRPSLTSAPIYRADWPISNPTGSSFSPIRISPAG